MSFLLAERARSECARSTRAVNDNLATPFEERWREGRCGSGVRSLCARATRGLRRPSLDVRSWASQPLLRERSIAAASLTAFLSILNLFSPQCHTEDFDKRVAA
jgi:hypothetical protein